MRPILVTGSAGHLGEAVMRRLRASGEPAIGLDIIASPFTDEVGSICDREVARRRMAGVRGVIHTATLHKPHVATHGRQQFVDVNVSGTLALLEEAAAAGVEGFVFTSTTSAFGSALTPAAGEPAAWITEAVAPIPKNIYGATKLAAEGLCELFARREALPVIVLRTSRFFPEDDDDAAVRAAYAPANAQVNELLHRRVDIADAVEAHLLALAAAPAKGFGRYIVSATTPLRREQAAALRSNPSEVISELYPECGELFASRGWRLPQAIDRVYDNSRARAELGWRPAYDFQHALTCLAAGQDFRSPLAQAVGRKGYHPVAFEDGPYPVNR